MGCSAAKNLTVEPLDGNRVKDLSNGKASQIRKVSITHSVSNVPPLEGEDPQAELLESATVNNFQKAPNGMSFEIAFEEEKEESVIKKFPPKRFQKLEEDYKAASPTLTLGKLQEKLEEAEIRRQQILQQRVQSAKYRNHLKKQASVSSMTDTNGHLQVPQEAPKPLNPYDVSYL